MIVYLRAVAVAVSERARSLKWINEGAAVREAHGLLAEWVLEPSSSQGETVAVTVWTSHEVFDAWIANRGRNRRGWSRCGSRTRTGYAWLRPDP